jgi:hypothetical protein
MQACIFHDLRMHPADIGEVSGLIEDNESHEKTSFQRINDLPILLAYSIEAGLTTSHCRCIVHAWHVSSYFTHCRGYIQSLALNV